MFEHVVYGADVAGVGEQKSGESVEAFAVLEAESVAVFAHAFAFAVAHVATDDGHDTHLGAGEFAFGGDVVGPAEFVRVFGRDSEGEARFGVGDGDGSGGYRVGFFDGFGECEAEGAVIELLGDQFCLVCGVG